MYHVYILQSLKDNRTYVGYSDNVERRFAEHNAGRANATKHRRPFKLLFTEEFSTAVEAKKREKYWKSGAGRRKLKQYFTST
jgi:putative endonuclease